MILESLPSPISELGSVGVKTILKLFESISGLGNANFGINRVLNETELTVQPR